MKRTHPMTTAYLVPRPCQTKPPRIPLLAAARRAERFPELSNGTSWRKTNPLRHQTAADERTPRGGGGALHAPAPNEPIARGDAADERTHGGGGGRAPRAPAPNEPIAAAPP